jgi:hypothetical protein
MSIIDQVTAQDMLERMRYPFKQDIAGTNTISISADTETLFLSNGATRNFSEGPAYFTDRYNTTTGVMAATTEYDSPVYAAKLSFNWVPDASSSGILLVRQYINDATPKLIGTYSKSYKGSAAFPESLITDWYWGTETGYDAKNDGVYWTIEFEHDGDVTNPSLLIHHAQ